MSAHPAVIIDLPAGEFNPLTATAPRNPGEQVRCGGVMYAWDNSAWNPIVTAVTDAVTGKMVAINSGTNRAPLGLADNGWVLIGDSITGQCDQNITVTAMSRTSNVVTVTATSHAHLSGQFIRVVNALPDDFNGYAAITRVDANTFTYPSVGADGSATLTGNPRGTFSVHDIAKGAFGDWFGYLNGKFGGGLHLIRNLGVGGWLASYGADPAQQSSWDAELAVANKAISDVTVLMGVNDIAAGATTASIVASLRSIYDWAIAKGARVWACDITPYGIGKAGYAALNAKIIEVNRWIRRECSRDPRLRHVPLYAAVSNSVTGALTAGMSGDDLHPGSWMARTMADTMYTVMNGIVRVNDLRAVSFSDCYGQDSGSINLDDYGPWVSTTGGSAGSGVTGNIAANLHVTKSAGATAACAVNVATYGYTQDITFTSSAASDNAQLDNTVTVPVARFTAGDEVVMLIDVSISGIIAGNLTGVYANLIPTLGGLTTNVVSHNNTTTALFSTIDTFNYTLITRPYIWNGAETALTAALRVTGGAAGAPVVIKANRRSIIKNPWV